MRNRHPRLLIAAAATSMLTVTAVMLPMLGDRAAANDRVVVVMPGQTLSEIALQQGVSVDELAG